MSEPTPSLPPATPKRWPLLVAGVVALVGVLAVGILIGKKSAGPTGELVPMPTEPVATTTVVVPPVAATAVDAGPPKEISAIPKGSAPSVWMDVHDPSMVRQALKQNPWLQTVLGEPLGKGFVGTWAAFLGTRGQDIRAEFTGALQDFLADRLLAQPFRVVWFGGEGASGIPALIMPNPASGARAAYDVLHRAVNKGSVVANRCPGSDDASPASTMTIHNWRVSEVSVYVGSTTDTIVMARHPSAVLQGLCVMMSPMSRTPGTDVEVALAGGPMGRESQMLGVLLGMSNPARFSFAVKNNQLVPVGIQAQVDKKGRMDAAVITDEMWKVVPEDMPVLLAAHVKLPRMLDAPSLKSHFGGTTDGDLLTRPVLLLWNPHADRYQMSDVALVWGRNEDASGLETIFNGLNTMHQKKVCGQLVLASTTEMIERLESTCAGKRPSVLHAAATVTAGLRAPTSVMLGVNLGKLLSGLTKEGFLETHPPSKPNAPPPTIPPEIEAAQRRLEELPFMGMRATVKDNTLVPGGFRS